jgi:hypothetical protein
MAELESWLKEATRCLSKDSATQVRTEIREHYDSAQEAVIRDGATAEEANRSAVSGLGDAKAANRQYRKVLLTSAEARILGEGNWEARAICSTPWLKWLLAALPAAAVLAAVALFRAGAVAVARTLFLGGIATGVFFAAPFLLPIYTPWRGRVFRVAKWAALIALFWLAFGPDALKWSWLLASCLWLQARNEWTRFSIRRKMPVAKWPKQLYL